MTTHRRILEESGVGKIVRFLTNSSAALLAAAGTAMLMSIGANAALVPPRDPLLMISMRTVFCIFAGLVLFVALVCLFSERTQLKASLTLWLILNVIVYALGVQWNEHNGNLIPCLSGLAGAFGISPGAAFLMAKVVCLYLLAGSCAVLWLGGGTVRPHSQETLTESLKMVCVLCGGHIEFSAENLGQKIPCPHCKATITLMKPKDVKTFCPACGGHIAFAAQQVGRTIACPHCKAAITLQRPATLKTACAHCGGHIAFPAHGIGQAIACPHCAAAITLKGPA